MNDHKRTPEQRELERLERERRRGRGNGVPEVPSSPEPPSPRPQPTRPARTRPPSEPSSSRPPRSDRGSRHPGRLAVLLALSLAFGSMWFVNALFQPFAGDGTGDPRIVVTIQRGASIGEIGDLLADKGIVANATFFGWRARLSGESANFKAGRFELSREMSYSSAISALSKGPVSGLAITIVEGRSRYEIARQVTDLGVVGDYMRATSSSRQLDPRRFGAPRSSKSLEGFLFPATYELPSGWRVGRLVAKQLQAFRQAIAEVDMSYARRKNLTIFDVVIVASLIEREVSVASERRLVAAVIYNRLKQGIPLGIDATTRFETRNWIEPLKGSTLRSDTPYNTRTNPGLPPGPIGNPGLASLKAAARPARVDHLYYVANPCKPGEHAFSATDAEFQADVRRYNQARAAAGDRQPSGC